MSDPAYRWVIKRNCSASPAQLALVFASIVLFSFLIGIAFALVGLWLVLPFVGLELLAVGLAFVCYGRHAADFERIELDAVQVRIERHDGGRVVTERFAAPWTRVELEESGGGWMRRVRLFVVAHGARVEVGRHLAEPRRRGLARELRQALRTTGAALA
jgi:uncharacterized membrane protein